ncbi:MAG: ATP-binding protein [Deltaproteobacteria bacterium]|nr:ATP-binding protein [Nannocystaceae bacterium]
MDDGTITGLEAALAATPDNLQLRAVLLVAFAQRRDHVRGRALLIGIGTGDLPEHGRIAAGELSLAAGEAEAALRFADGIAAPAAQIVVARACAELGLAERGKAAYLAAVSANPTLENLELRARLSAETPIAGEGRLRVLSNDAAEEPELDRLLAPPQQPLRFDDVGGLDDVKTQIRRRIILPFQKPSVFQRFKRSVGGGILLYGPPGCGKTMIARATAGEVDAQFMNVAISDVLDMYIGESERKLHALFERAREKTPAVLFFDELEALAGNRKYARESTSAKLISLFLSEMDGFAQANAGVLVLGATNTPWAIDPAFQRPGRFDRTLFVPPPDAAARRAILGQLLDGRPTSGDLDLDRVVAKTSGFSGADLRNLVETAVDEAIEASLAGQTEVPVERAHLVRALAAVRATTLEWLTTARNYARYANEGGRYDEVLAFIERHGRSG